MRNLLARFAPVLAFTPVTSMLAVGEAQSVRMERVVFSMKRDTVYKAP